MARTAFYNNTDIEKKTVPLWKVGIYVRLSRDDGTLDESESVKSQRYLLETYVKSIPEFAYADTFIDDGYTGTNFNRPAFKRLMTEVERNNIDCIVVKDLSRFGRNYIEAGRYLEDTLPKYNCRFISIGEDLDSYKNPVYFNGIMLQIKNMFNDHFSGQISKNMRIAYDAKRKEGKLVAAFAPFGYLKDPNDKEHLIIDTEVAHIVISIFKWRLDGRGVNNIAKKLNGLGYISPGRYRYEKGIYHKQSRLTTAPWSAGAVRKILSNKVYMGALEQKKTTTINHKNRKIITVSEENRFIVYDTHEPIVDKSIFNGVQDLYKRCERTSVYSKLKV